MRLLFATFLYAVKMQSRLSFQDVFLRLPSLEHLSLRFNFLHQIPDFSHSGKLRHLQFQGFDGSESFQIFDGAFQSLPNLEVLELMSLSLGHLTHKILNGLDNLITLNLEKSNILSMESKLLRAVPRLRFLLMAHCTGLDKVPVDTLIGKF